MPAAPYPVAQSSRRLTTAAWIVTVLISTLPDILCMELVGSVPGWLLLGKLALLFGGAVLAAAWRPLKPLRNFCILLFVVLALLALRERLDFTIPALQALLGGSAFDARMQAEQTGKLAVALAVIAALLLLGYRRRDLFLSRGDLRTPIEPVPLLGFPKPDPWPRFALQWGFYIAAALALVQFFALRPTSTELANVLPMLPSILFYAALNAFNEEITLRVPMLAALEPLAGSKQALWMAAYFFGIAHYFGTPGGILGGIASIFMGWILGKAMLETRGLFWAWWIHFLSDVAIFVFLALALAR